MALYVLDELTFAKDFTLSVGVRRQQGDFDITSKPAGAPNADKSYNDGQFAWSAGLSYRLAEASKIYARVARTFRYPAADEYFTFGGFMPLDPERAMNYEAGAQYTFMTNGRASLAAYWMEMTDEIAYNSATMKNENLNDTKHVGLEAGLRVPFGAGNPSYAFATLGWEKAEFTAGPNAGKTLPLVPEFKASLGVSAALFKGFRAIAQLNYVGERYMGQDFANVAEKMGSYQTVDLRLSYTWKRFNFFLNGLNIFGQEYETASFYSAWGSGYYPAPTQQVWGGVNITF
jgi:iron complex outermembrane receptor protein